MKTSYLFVFIVILLLAGCKSEEKKAQERFEARKMLSDIGVEFTIDEYHDRIKEGDYSAVELFLKAGMTPNADDEAAYKAIQYNRLDILKLLFEHGLDVDDINVVLGAIAELNFDAIEFLRIKGASFNKLYRVKTRTSGITEDLPIVYALDFNRTGDSYGRGAWSSILSVYDKKYYEMAEYLFDHGATLSGWTRGDTPLYEIYVTDELKERAPSLYNKLQRN